MTEVTKGLKALIGQKMEKIVKFMETDVTIYKLTAGAVKDIQAAAAVSQDLLKEREQMESRIKRYEEADKVEEADKLRAELDDDKRQEEQAFEVIRLVISQGVEGGTDLSDEDFNGFPLDELNKLAEAVMQWSGIAAGKKGK